MINEIEVGKKYRLIDKEGYMSSKYNGNYNRRLLATVGVFDVICVWLSLPNVKVVVVLQECTLSFHPMNIICLSL